MNWTVMGLLLCSALDVASPASTPASTAPPTTPQGTSSGAGPGPGAPAPVPAPEPLPRVLVLELVARNIDEGTARIATGIISAAADDDARFAIDTVADLRAMADMEGTKQLLGCEVDSCLSEMAQAMGSRFIFHGDVGSLGGLIVVNLSLYDAVSARSVARRSLQAQGPAALPGVLTPAVADMLAAALPPNETLGEGTREPQQVNTASADPGLFTPSFLALGSGLALSIGGAAMMTLLQPEQKFLRASGAVIAGIGVIVLLGSGVTWAVDASEQKETGR